MDATVFPDIPYRIEQKVVDGGACELYDGRAESTDERVRVKVLRCGPAEASAVARFLEEARTYRGLFHPNLARVLDVGCLADGRPYAVSERPPGEDVRSRLAAGGPLGVEVVQSLLEALGGALDCLHAGGLVHRGLTPEAVFLSGEGGAHQAVLCDFGVGAFDRRPDYTAPECLQGQPNTPRSDLYSLGVLVYECLAGTPPFTADATWSGGGRVLRPLPAFCERFTPLLRKLLSPDPAERHASGAEVANEFSVIRHSQTIPLAVATGRADAAPGPGDVLGAYELVSFLGAGAMGTVFLARHRRLGRQVAIKLLPPEFANNRDLVKRFFQEAKSVNDINHEHIVEVHDFADEPLPDGTARVYYVMEYLKGSTLESLAREERLSPGRAVSITRQVCRALDAAHEVGVVHRDIKPENIFVTDRGALRDYVKVLDFGVAKLHRGGDPASTAGESSDAPTATMLGEVIGTPIYMAPEQGAGETVDLKADIYALGAVLYRLLAGRPPIDDPDTHRLLARKITAPAPALPDVTPTGERIAPGLRSIVMQCLERDPLARPASMAALCDLLEPFGAAEARPRARPLVAAVAAFGVLAAVVFAAWAVAPGPPAAPAAEMAAPPAPAPSPALRKVSVSVRSNPAGATVTRADTGVVLGKTPLTAELPAADAELSLAIEAPNHAPASHAVRLDANASVDVTLLPIQSKAPRRRVPAPLPRQKVSTDGILDPFQP